VLFRLGRTGPVVVFVDAVRAGGRSFLVVRALGCPRAGAGLHTGLVGGVFSFRGMVRWASVREGAPFGPLLICALVLFLCSGWWCGVFLYGGWSFFCCSFVLAVAALLESCCRGVSALPRFSLCFVVLAAVDCPPLPDPPDSPRACHALAIDEELDA